MKKKYLLLCFIIYLLFLSSMIFSQKPAINRLSKTNPELYKDYTKFNINNISTYIYSNGDTDISTDGNSGFEFPKESNKHAVFESGFVFGGKVNGKKLVGGSTYEQGLRPGRILEDGTPQDPKDPSARVYRVRPDYMYAPLLSEINDEERTYQEIFYQYEKDWNEWPGNYGAPYFDTDENGEYDPDIDIPGVPGAHQTIWYVANDFDSVYSKILYGSTPLYVEFQVTIWGYNIPNTIYENIMFKKYKIINKNDFDISPMYISQWADTDIGDAGDDFVGCDTLLNLAYCYNGDNDDGTYLTTPPAIGYQLVQGPITEGTQTDEAFFNGKKISGYKNLYMTSHFFFIGSDPVYNDPDLGEYKTGTLQYYNLFEGLITTTGTPFLHPISGNSVVFTLDGNPMTGEGWIDGILHPPGDRRNGFVSGPFNLAVGDTQEVVIAQSAAIGTDRLNSLLLLKENSAFLQQEYENIYDILKPNIFNEVNKLSTVLNHNKFSAYDIIELNLERIDSVENFSMDGYEFQGYNIYQFGSDSYHSSAGHRIFTYDKIDDITEIIGDKYNPWTNMLIEDVVVNGTNSGIPKTITIEKDYISNSPLIKGRNYIYGIAPYFCNRNENRFIEGKLTSIDVIFQEDLPGASYLDVIETEAIYGKSDVAIDVEVVNAYELTGDTYEITFGEQHYYLNEDGVWVDTNYPDSIGKRMDKPSDQSPSKLIPLPSIYGENQTLNIYLKLEINAPDFNWSDGVRLTFPDGININSAEYAGSNHRFKPDINGQVITWGNKDTTYDGGFSGEEELIVNINYTEPTFTIEYEIFDDGWSKFYLDATGDSIYYNLGDGIVHASGIVVLTGEIGYQFKTERFWDLYNINQGKYVLEYQTMFGGNDINNPIWPLPINYEPVVDGFRIKLNGTFDKPRNFANVEIITVGETILTSSYDYNDPAIVLTNYTVFGGVESSTALENFGVGTDNIDELQQNIELRFTGIFDEGTMINDHMVYQVIEGGQMATCFRMVNGGALAAHPLNPNPGNTEPFLVRIPFEVWNIEDPDNLYQINFTFRDRVRDGTEDPFWSWNMDERMYGIIVNSPYDSDQIIQIDDGKDDVNKFATWALVFKRTNYYINDIVKIIYPNPIQFTDKYGFTTYEAPTQKISPDKYEVFQNYPNPFNPNTKIRYFIPEDSQVKITIYNTLGQNVKTLVNQQMKAGKYESEFNGSNFASGVYIYKIEATNFSETKKMLLLK